MSRESHPTAKGIKLDNLQVEIEGKIDLNGFLQLQPIRAGLNGVTVKIRVKSDADDEVLQELAKVTSQASPVYDSVANPVSIERSVERM